MLLVFCAGCAAVTVHMSLHPGSSKVVTTWGRTDCCSTQRAPFFPCPEVVTSSTSGSAFVEEESSSERKAGSPMAACPHGPMLSRLSHTSNEYEAILVVVAAAAAPACAPYTSRSSSCTSPTSEAIQSARPLEEDLPPSFLRLLGGELVLSLYVWPESGNKLIVF